MKTVAIIQARLGSTRLPGKVMMDLNGKPVLERVIERIKRAKLVNDIVVATEIMSAVIIDYCIDHNINVYCGSENDVMKRVLEAALRFNVDTIVEITADCPLIDPDLIDDCVALYQNNPLIDYVSNCVPVRSFPDGMDVQVYSKDVLNVVNTNIDIKKHVGYHIATDFNQSFNCVCIPAPSEYRWPNLRLTLDELEDFQLIEKIYHHFELWNQHDFRITDILEFLRINPVLLKLNQDVRTKTPGEG